MGKSTMYAVYSFMSDKPYRYRIIDSKGKSRYVQARSEFENTINGYESCFCLNKFTKKERVDSRKEFDSFVGYIQVKLFDFEE